MPKSKKPEIKEIKIIKITESAKFEDVSLDEHDMMPTKEADIDPFFDKVPRALRRDVTVTDLSIFKRPIPLEEEKAESGCGCFSFLSKK
jgi:hypothetical protein